MWLVDENAEMVGEVGGCKVSILRDKQENAKGRTCEERNAKVFRGRGGGRRRVDGGESWIKLGGQYTTRWQRCKGTYL